MFRDDIDETDWDADSDEEYEKILDMHNKIKAQHEAEIEEKYRQDKERVSNLLVLFTDNINRLIESNELDYDTYHNLFGEDDRNNIFEGLAAYYSDENIVNDSALFAFKRLILSMIGTNRKYKENVADIVLTDTETNMLVEVNKGVFRVCVRDNENDKVPPRHICYLKSNGNSYYLSG